MSDLRWRWSPRLLLEFEAAGLRWKVVKHIPPERLGSSPGDATYLGSERLLELEYTCPSRWVAHELAHFYVCRRKTPHLLDSDNWGFESHLSDDDVFTYEECAARVTIGILIALRLPWRKAAWEMSMADYSQAPKVWRDLKATCMEETKTYLRVTDPCYLREALFS